MANSIGAYSSGGSNNDIGALAGSYEWVGANTSNSVIGAYSGGIDVSGTIVGGTIGAYNLFQYRYIAESGGGGGPTPTITRIRQYANGTFEANGFVEVASGPVLRLAANLQVQAYSFIEEAGRTTHQINTSGVYRCAQLVETA